MAFGGLPEANILENCLHIAGILNYVGVYFNQNHISLDLFSTKERDTNEISLQTHKKRSFLGIL